MARNVTTEWEDMQVKMGNWAPVAKETPTEDIYNETIERNERYDPKLLLNDKQLEEMAEDDPDFNDEDPFMKEWREKRMMEVAQEAAKPKFGSVYEINKPEWEDHVTKAPAESNVVIHLYQEYVIECKVLNEILNELAAKHKNVKFIKCVATKAVENFQDRDLPALIFYKGGELQGQLVPCGTILGGKRMTSKTVEYVLWMHQ